VEDGPETFVARCSKCKKTFYGPWECKHPCCQSLVHDLCPECHKDKEHSYIPHGDFDRVGWNYLREGQRYSLGKTTS
jgi:hypothetical protein